jgi:uncharacterized membrane protein YdjX (TVP38/TMEM64 family)
MWRKIGIPFLVSCIVVIITFLVFENLEAFFINALNNVSQHKEVYSLVSFLVLASDIILPVPSSIVMYTNGYILGLIAGSFISLVAVMIGAIVGYYLGKMTSLGIKAKEDENAERVLLKYGTMSILISRGIPILSESICIVCGYNKMPLKLYLILNLIGYIPVCLVYGFFGSAGYDKNTFLISFGCSLLISALFWFLGKKMLLNYFVAQDKPNA